MGLGKTGKGACCWLGLLRQGGWQGSTLPSESYQYQEQEEMDSYQEGRVLLGEDEGFPDVTPLETKNRGIWTEKEV